MESKFSFSMPLHITKIWLQIKSYIYAKIKILLDNTFYIVEFKAAKCIIYQ